MSNDISDKDKKDWQEFISSKKKLYDKDQKKQTETTQNPNQQLVNARKQALKEVDKKGQTGSFEWLNENSRKNRPAQP